MKHLIYYFILFLIGSLVSCNETEKVLYEELTPSEFSSRIDKCPVAYLPLGTLEWHSFHLPLGSDGIQSQEFFKRLATEVGGIVLPSFFLGPDNDTIINGIEYYGMDCSQPSYPIQKLTGSAYWVNDSTFDVIINSVMKQLSRAGFKIVVAHGHGPSTHYIEHHSREFKDRYNLKVMNCWGSDSSDLCLMCDHAAANETSLMMYLRPDLVKMEYLPKNLDRMPLGTAGKDPRIHASKKFGRSIIDFEIKKMSIRIINELSEQNR